MATRRYNPNQDPASQGTRATSGAGGYGPQGDPNADPASGNQVYPLPTNEPVGDPASGQPVIASGPVIPRQGRQPPSFTGTIPTGFDVTGTPYQPTGPAPGSNSQGPFRDPNAGSSVAPGRERTYDPFVLQDRANLLGMEGEVSGYGPDAQSDVLNQLRQFTQQPEGPSRAEALMGQAADTNMADALSLARGTRGGAGAQARAMRVAQAQNAATGVDTANNLAALRAGEAQQRRQQDLGALTAAGNVAGSADQSILDALGLRGDLLSEAVRSSLTGRAQDAQIYGTDTIQRGQDIDAMVAEREQNARLKEAILGSETALASAQTAANAQGGGLFDSILDIVTNPQKQWTDYYNQYQQMFGEGPSTSPLPALSLPDQQQGPVSPEGYTQPSSVRPQRGYNVPILRR